MVRTELAVRVLIALATNLSAATACALEPVVLDLDGIGPAAQPNLAVDTSRNRFVLSWQARLADGCAALRAAEIEPGTTRPGRTRDIASGCDWFVNWADIPSIVVTDAGGWFAHWLQRSGPGTYAYDIRLSHSGDRGRTWSPPFSPHRDGTPTQHGFVSMAPITDGSSERALLVWLDGRNAALAPAENHEQHHDHGQHGHEAAMSLRSALIAADGTVDDEAEIDARVCSCCPTGLVRLGHGDHLAIYRDRSEGEVRDISFAHRSGDGWMSGIPVHHDGWTIAGCPVNGPALAVHGDQVLAAWSTMADGNGVSVRYRLLDSAALPAPANADSGVHELESGSAVVGRVDVAATPDGWLLSWLGGGKRGDTVLRLAHLDRDLRERTRIDIASLPAGRDVGLPRLAALGRHAVLVWTEIDDAAAHEPGQRRPTRLRAVHLASGRPNTDGTDPGGNR